MADVNARHARMMLKPHIARVEKASVVSVVKQRSKDNQEFSSAV